MGRPVRDNILSFEHDADAFEHPKFLALRARFGWEGDGRFWALNSLIARAPGCKIDLKRDFVKAGIMVKLGLAEPDFDAFIAFLCDRQACGLVFQEDGLIWTDRIQEEHRSASEWREHDRERKELARKAKDEARARKTVVIPDLSGGKDGISNGSPAEKGGFPEHRTVPSPSPSPTPTPAAAPDNGGFPPNDVQPGSPGPLQDAAAAFPSVLKKTLEDAGIVLAPDDLDAVTSELIAASVTSQAFLNFAVKRATAKTVENPRIYFLQGITKHRWHRAWSAPGNGSKPKGETPLKTCTVCGTEFPNSMLNCPTCAENAAGVNETPEAIARRKKFMTDNARGKRTRAKLHPDAPENQLTGEEDALLAAWDAEQAARKAAAPEEELADFPEVEA